MRRTTLKLVSGADSGSGSGSGMQFDLREPEVILGRDPSADIVLESPGISRRHARIASQGDTATVEDLGSSNGTFVNGQRIDSPTVLQSGDEIGLGQTVKLIFQVEAARQYKSEPTAVGATMVGGETMLGGAAGAGASTASTRPLQPQFSVAIAGSEPQLYDLKKDVISIGRADDNDIVIPSKIVSRHHANLERFDGGYRFVPSPEAGNPVLFEGRPLAEPRQLRHEDKLRIGSADPGSMVSLQYISPAEAAVSASALAENIDFGAKTELTFGRDPSNDVVLDSPKISRFHARLERVGQRYRVQDLRSSNGTFVNNQRVEGAVWIQPDDAIRIGPYRFVVGADELAAFDESHGLRVEAIGLNKWVRKNLNILQNISLVFQPREFIVVVGQSGGGKSTLVDAIAGYRPATHGRVLVNDIDTYKNFDAIRHNIGFVPQRDIIHMELTVYQALDYAARLRMPPDTTGEERHKRIMEVLDDLDLTHRKDVQISGLSGGQQKRVSIGVELLTSPGLFFLDEPTSGLDPGTETALMHLMRRLADQGRTIVLITHATKNVMLADKVLFLARGGYVAWFGTPDDALRYFDQFRSERDRRARDMEFDEIYAILDDPSRGSPEDWAQRYMQTEAYQHSIVGPLEERQHAMATPSRQVTAAPRQNQRRQVGSLRQFLILSGRNLKILTRDRFSLILMLAAGPLVALLDVVLAFALGRQPFDHVVGNPRAVMITLFLLPVYGVMVGALATMREIVKEQDIYKRERLINLKILPYVLSKVWFAALIALYHAAAYTIVRYLAFDMPGGVLEFAIIYVTLVLSTIAGMMLGLFTSALAPNANAAPLIVILFVLPQIVLGGAMIPLPNVLTMPTITRWGFEALMATTGPGSDVAADACWLVYDQDPNALTPEYKEDNCRCMGTNVFDAASCNFPSVGQFYNPSLEDPEPVSPGDPPPQPPQPSQETPPRPTEPAVPPRPTDPPNQSDPAQNAQFIEDMREYEAEVNAINEQFRADMAAFEAEMELYEAAMRDYQVQVQQYQLDLQAYQDKMVRYQEERARWLQSRQVAIQGSERIIRLWRDDYGWTFADKSNPVAFTAKIARTWTALGLISLIFFVAILILQKRKDII